MANIALLGYGTVGRSAADLLIRASDRLAAAAGEPVTLQYILVRRAYPGSEHAPRFVTDFDAIERDGSVRVVAEAIGGTGAALEYCRRALAAGKHVVTANKQLIAEYGHELTALARERGVQLLFEPSVAGGIPLLHPLRECFGACSVREVAGILNGTTNYILTEMRERGASYDAALARAQELGYAEQDPAADVGGLDAGRKTCILASMLTGLRADPAAVCMRGITDIRPEDAALAACAGMSIRLLGRVIRAEGGTAVFVRPHAVAGSSPLCRVSGVTNGALVRAEPLGEVFFSGPGAGGEATACALLSDVLEILRAPGRPQPSVWSGEALPLLDPDTLPMRWLIRTDEPAGRLEAALGALRPVRTQEGVCGAVTGTMTRRALDGAGLRLKAAWPVFE